MVPPERAQLRAPLFPGPALLTFLPPGEAYQHPALPLHLPWHLWSPCTNPLMLDCLTKAGFTLVKVCPTPPAPAHW